MDRCVTLTESTSPSALLTASLDAARRQLAVRGGELLAETIAGLERARAAVREIPGLDVLDERLVGRPGVHRLGPAAPDRRREGHREHRDSRRLPDARAGRHQPGARRRERHRGGRSAWGRTRRRARTASSRSMRHAVEALGARGGDPQAAVRRASAVGQARDVAASGVPRAAGAGRVRGRRRKARRRVARRLPARHPERAARRAADPGDDRLHQRGGRARRLGPGRRRSQPADGASGGRSERSPAWGVDSEHGRLLDVLLCPPDNFRWLATSAISQATLERRAPLRRRARGQPARGDGRGLRGGRRPRAPAGARSGASVSGVRSRLERDDPGWSGDHPAPPMVAARRVRGRDPLLRGERDPDPRHDHRRAPSRGAT